MLKTTKNKVSKIFKGTVLGVAGFISLSAIPFSTLQGSSTGAAPAGTSSISVDAAQTSAKKGVPYEIKTAKYLKGSETPVEIKDNNTTGTIKTDISVKYKNSNIEEVITSSSTTGVAGTFTPTMAGTYTITYSVNDNGKEYSYNYDVKCEVSEATFEFVSNSKNVLPSVYDLSMMETPKNVVISNPKVLKADGKENTAVVFSTSKPAGATEYVIISVTGGQAAGINEGLTYDDVNKELTISGEKLKECGAGTYTISYTYYQNDQFVATTTKTFDVAEKYYKTTSEDMAEAGYTLNASFATTKPDKASTGVAVNLPTVKATTSAKNAPVSETVNVSFDVKVYQKNTDGKYVVDVSDSVDKKENTFTAPANGDYMFVYTVKDFYGHEVTGDSMTFYIRGVKDDIAPTVAIYDAKVDQPEVDGKVEYISAKNAVKSKTVNRNMVVYAIGANDNVGTEDLTLTRAIKDAAGKTKLSVSDYNNKNLIFNFGTKEGSGLSAYAQFVEDNAVIANAMSTTDKASDDAIAAWLKTNNFLIVTHDEADKPADEAAKTALINSGKAYVENKDNYKFSTQTYSIYYIAEDKAGNLTENDYVTMYVTTDKDFTDTVAPTITFSSSLQDTYLPTQTIKFVEPKPSDDDDRNVEMVVSYTYLTSDKSTVVGNAIYPELTDNSEYEIDLSAKPENASWVKVLVEATDDYGNVGTWSKTIRIADSDDNRAIKLVEVVEADNSQVKQGEKVALPKLVYNDDLVDYMTQTVEVYYVSGENYKAMPSENASTLTDSRRERYVLNAGTFTASYAGNYQVVVSVKDAGNNSIATFFDFTVAGSTPTENIVVENISSETVNLDVDENKYLPSPTVKVVENDTVGFVGIEETDNVKTATYYSVTAVSAETNYYNLTKYNFVANAAGKYEIQYNVFLIEYQKANIGTSLKLVDGELKLIKSGTEYFVFVDMETGALAASQTLTGAIDTTVTAQDFANAGIKLHPLTTDVQKIKVVDDTAPVINVDSSAYVAQPVVGNTIEIQRIAAVENSKKGINPEKSYVEITTSRASGSSNTEKVYMKDWENERTTGNLTYADGVMSLKLAEHGNYKITYYVEDYSGNSDTETYSFGNGDTQKAQITIKDGFLNKAKDSYVLGKDNLVLDLSKIDLDDFGKTTEDELKNNMTITVKNIDTGVEVNLTEGTDNNYALETAGTYRITIKTVDDAGWTSEQTVDITVSAKSAGDVNKVYKTVGTVLIVLSALVLVGVVGYFIYSKFKLDKELKGSSKKNKKK